LVWEEKLVEGEQRTRRGREPIEAEEADVG